MENDYLNYITEGGRPVYSIEAERAVLGAMLAVASGILKDAKERMVDIDRIIDSAEQRLYEIRAEDCKQSPALVKNIIEHKVYNRLEKLQNPQTRDEFIGIPYGIERLDKITTGLNKSDLIVLASRPGFGKTTMALNIARNAAIDSGKTVCFFSMEMSSEQITERLLGGESGVDRARLHAGKLSDTEKTLLKNAGERLSKADLYIDDMPGITVNEIRAKLRKMGKVDLVIIDYLGLMRSFHKTYSPVIEMAEITRGLKILAKEFNIPVILCAQILHKSVKKGKVKKPTLNDLHSFIVCDADTILILHRLPYFVSLKNKSNGIEDGDLACIVAKNLHGEIGTVPLSWDAEHLRFG